MDGAVRVQRPTLTLIGPFASLMIYQGVHLPFLEVLSVVSVVVGFLLEPSVLIVNGYVFVPSQIESRRLATAT